MSFDAKPSYSGIICVLILLSFSLNSVGQIAVGPIEMVKLKSGEFELSDLKKLKSSKTIFVYRPGDNLQELKSAVEDVWTVTEISFVPYSTFKTSNIDGFSILSIAGVNTNVTNMSSGMNYDHTHIYLQLWMMGKNKRGKPEKKSFCRIDLHPEGKFFGEMPSGANSDALDYVYNDGVFRNWHPGFIRNQLQVVNQYLSDNSERWLYDNESKNSEVKQLAKNKLYVVDYALMDFNKFNGDESKRLDEAKIFKGYPYDYELINAKALSDKIIASNDPFYYLMYVKSSTDKYITVYNSKTGKIVYTKYSPASYKVKDDDLKDLAKAVK